MRLKPLHKKIIAYLEPLRLQDAANSIIERVLISETVTGVLRRSRQGAPMIWDLDTQGWRCLPLLLRRLKDKFLVDNQ